MKYKSIVVTQHGGPEVMQIVENDLRPPSAGEARIKVLAAAVCRPDVTVRRGEALYTGTPLEQKLPFVPGYAVIGDVDSVLVMMVNPGFGGQEFIAETLPKIARVRQMMIDCRLERDIEVDGGIGAATAPGVVKAGANLLVAGAFIFGSQEGVAAAIHRLRESVES